MGDATDSDPGAGWGRASPTGGELSRTALTITLVSASLAVLVAAYMVLVLTARGQQFDNLAFEGRKATDLGVRRALTAVMRIFTLPLVGAASVAVLADAIRRRRWKAGAFVGLSVVICVGATRVLKALLPRPYLVDLPYTSTENTFPRGHTTAVMALTLAWLWTARRTRRDRHLVASISGLVAWVTTMLGSGWHRPGDVLGGLAIATVLVTIFAAAAEWLRPECRIVQSGTDESSGAVVAGITAVLGSLAFVVMVRNPFINPNHSLATYLLGVFLCNGFAVAAVITFARGTGSPRSGPTAT